MKTIIIIILILLFCTISYADDSEPIPIDTIPPVEFDTTLTDSSILDTSILDTSILDTSIIDTSIIAVDSADTVVALPAKDTILYIHKDIMNPYTLVNDSTNYETRLYQNPTKALFKSMLIPGWGQYGNKKYYKAVVYAALDIWLISNAIKYGGEASDLFKLYESDTTIAGRNSYYAQYETKKDSRNKYTWFAVIVSFISMFDAYVDAHLSGFPDKERFGDIDIDIRSDSDGGVKAVLQFPFNP